MPDDDDPYDYQKHERRLREFLVNVTIVFAIMMVAMVLVFLIGEYSPRRGPGRWFGKSPTPQTYSVPMRGQPYVETKGNVE